jgi:surface antigen
MSFKIRTTKPEAGNKYYITKAKGGYSDAIQGKPVDSDCNVLSNCVGYAYGRFNEIGGYGYCKYLRPVNAENFIQYANGLEVGQTPKVGACMVWRKGATLSNSDGAGHVAIVEKVVSDTQVMTSESAYNGKAFYNSNRSKGSGNWGMGSAYTFLGFIYNPAVSGITVTETKPVVNTSKLNASANKTTVTTSSTAMRRGNSGSAVKELQQKLIRLGYSCGGYGADGVYGQDTENAVRKFQTNNNLTQNGVADSKTLSAINKAASELKTVKVKITASLLNVRAGAGTTYKVLRTVKKDSVHELLEEKNGWGKIASGWISSKYYKKM